MRKSRFVAVAVAAVALAIPAVAMAANGIARHPSDPSYAEVWNQYKIKACDRHVDGHRVRAHYDTIGSPEFIVYTAWAPSGGCTEPVGATLGFPIRKHRICVEQEGCGRWFPAIYN